MLCETTQNQKGNSVHFSHTFETSNFVIEYFLEVVTRNFKTNNFFTPPPPSSSSSNLTNQFEFPCSCYEKMFLRCAVQTPSAEPLSSQVSAGSHISYSQERSRELRQHASPICPNSKLYNHLGGRK